MVTLYVNVNFFYQHCMQLIGTDGFQTFSTSTSNHTTQTPYFAFEVC